MAAFHGTLFIAHLWVHAVMSKQRLLVLCITVSQPSGYRRGLKRDGPGLRRGLAATEPVRSMRAFSDRVSHLILGPANLVV